MAFYLLCMFFACCLGREALKWFCLYLCHEAQDKKFHPAKHGKNNIRNNLTCTCSVMAAASSLAVFMHLHMFVCVFVWDIYLSENSLLLKGEGANWSNIDCSFLGEE